MNEIIDAFVPVDKYVPNVTVQENDIPDINIVDFTYNPTVTSPNTPFELSFYSTKETMLDIENYKAFIDNAISRFRHSKTYTNYKAYLYSIGMDRCQVLGNITKDMASIEMHHNFLTLFDIAVLVTEHVLNTTGYICTFDLVDILKTIHRQNMIPVVMVCKTVHQLYHNNKEFILPAQMCFGHWMGLLGTFRYGITLDIANKVSMFINSSIEHAQSNNLLVDGELLNIRNHILEWRDYNVYSRNYRIGNNSNTSNFINCSNTNLYIA